MYKKIFSARLTNMLCRLQFIGHQSANEGRLKIIVQLILFKKLSSSILVTWSAYKVNMHNIFTSKLSKIIFFIDRY